MLRKGKAKRYKYYEQKLLELKNSIPSGREQKFLFLEEEFHNIKIKDVTLYGIHIGNYTLFLNILKETKRFLVSVQ